jgi:molybdenum cofactor cytidylyltransferase/nicotine blue oxidoreductase
VTLHGLLLAAGAGTRMGRPKALVRDEAGEPWLVRGVRALREGGCDAVTVVLGAGADEARPLLDGTGARPVLADDWAAGLAASLRAGLRALADEDADAVAALVSLVDLPDVHADVVRRVAALGGDPAAVARAAYDGVPGHPVLLGRDHWAGVLASAAGDRGARDYLATRPVVLVECGDLATGCDRDTP